MLQETLRYYDQAAAELKDQFSIHTLNRLRFAQERTEMALSPQLQDGSCPTIKAFIVKHSNALGPCKGGIRMTADVNLDDATSLAMEMSWKCALIGVPFGGGKSGIAVDARQLSAFDKETIIRSYTRHALHHIDPLVYVPAPDMGTTEKDMGHIKDAILFSTGHAATHGCYVTGKPVILGGIPGRRAATGRGVAVSVAAAVKDAGMDIQSARVAIQGFGNVGGAAADILQEMGCRIVAVSDIDGAVSNPAGLDVQALHQHVTQSGSVKGFAGGTPMPCEQLLETDCDVLVPAAAGGQITAGNAALIRARIIGEGANGPTTCEADEILQKRGITVVPDILCNAGGVFVSYLEYTQETQKEQMTEERVNERLAERMIQTYRQVSEMAAMQGIALRRAAMLLAVQRVCEAVEARGSLP